MAEGTGDTGLTEAIEENAAGPKRAKGDSGEVELKPQADTRLHMLANASSTQLLLPRVMATRAQPVETPSAAPLRALWQGHEDDSYGTSAVLGTAALALALLEPALDIDGATKLAGALWRDRNTARLN